VAAAQIFVVGAKVSLYLHFDGYPDGVMPAIIPALEHYSRQAIWVPDRVLAFLVNALAIQAEIRRQAVLVGTKGEGIFKSPLVPWHFMAQGEEVFPGVEYLYIVNRDKKPKVQIRRVIRRPLRMGASLTEVMADSTPLDWKPLGEGATWMAAMRNYYKGGSWGRIVKRIARKLFLPKVS
jgi:hypothetical protein